MSGTAEPQQFSLAARAAAWSVHALTASGAAMGLLALLEAARGDLRASALWMLAGFAVDCVDGTLARAAQVHERTPSIDGRRLDDVIDFLNYVIVPCFFLAHGGFVSWGWAALPALASAYQFAQADAKTEDHFFLGFPSYWNFVAIYVWLLGASPLATEAWLAGLSVLVFVPIKYLYPSRMTQLAKTMILGGAAFTLLLAAACLAEGPAPRLLLAQISLLYPAAYFGLSLRLGGLARGDR
jgi:phosphatidylcholine synthase